MGKPARFATEEYAVFTGRGTVRDDRVLVDTEDGEISFARADLMAILPGTTSELDRWGVQMGLGLDANEGNTKQTAFNANVAIRREDRTTRAEVAYSGTVGTASGQENINRHRIDTRGDLYLSKRYYWSILDMPFLYDKFQNIDARVGPSTGPGLQIFDNPGLEWSVVGSVGYQYTSFISAPPGGPSDVNDAIVRFSTDFKWDIVQNLEFKLRHDTTVVATQIGLTNLYTRVALKYEVTWLLKLETAIVHNRIFDPVPRADGTRPESDDVQLIVGFNLATY